MTDWEEMILLRQELIEIWEDDPDSPFLQNAGKSNWWDDIPPEEFEEVKR